MDVRRFRGDLNELAERACAKDSSEVRLKVFRIVESLVGLYRKNLVKINHSALELVCARGLVSQGYEVKVEHRLDKVLVCDIMGIRGDGPLIVEIETGFIPPEAALEPSAYARGRVASKIARYSKFAGKFALGTNPSYVLDFPLFFVKPPKARSLAEGAEIKAVTDVRYNRPAISMADIMHARLHSVFIVDVDSAATRELDPETYAKAASAFMKWSLGGQGLNLQGASSGRGFNFADKTY